MIRLSRWRVGGLVAGIGAGLALMTVAMPLGGGAPANVFAQAAPTSTPVPAGGVPAGVTITPVEACNAVKTQHTFTATVKDSAGNPVAGAQVEWLLNRFPAAVGDIISMTNSANKVDNTYGIAKTDANGQSTMTLTSTRAGDTDITAYVPGIADVNVHKVFAVKHWIDAAAVLPGNATNVAGTAHVMAVMVTKSSDGTPLVGVPVRFTITGTPENGFLGAAAPGAKSVVVSTDATGAASMTLQQITPGRGTNVVRIEVLSPTNPACVLFSKDITKTWTSSTPTLTKTGPAQAGIGTQVTYQITANNSGNASAQNGVLVDTIPAGMSYVGSNPSGSNAGNTVTWNVGTLDPNVAHSYALVLQANQVGTWTNNAQLTTTGNPPVNASATTVVVAPTLAITKTCPAQANIGVNFDSTITVGNIGVGGATGVAVVDTLPAGLTYVSSNPPASTVQGQVVAWNIGTLAAGATLPGITLTAKGNAPGTQTNTVVVNSNEHSTAQAQCTITIVAPSVSITKTGPPAIPSGFTRPYVLNVTNTGPVQLNDVTITDALPAGLIYDSSTPSGTVSGSSVSWNVGTLAPAQAKSVTIVIKGGNPGTYTNVATVTTREGVTSRATLDIHVVAVPPGATMSLVDAVDPIAVGEQDTYTIKVDDQAVGQDIHNVGIVFTIPAQMNFVSATGPTAFTVSGQQVTFAAVATMTPTDVLTYTVTVHANAAASVIAASTLTYNEFPGPITVQEGTTIFTP